MKTLGKYLLLIAFLILIVNRGAYAEVPPEIKKILKRGELVVAMYDQDIPPYFENKNKTLSGLDVDLCEALAKSLGVKLKIKLIPKADQYSDILKQLDDKNVDLVAAALYPSLDRSKEVRFTESYDTVDFLFLLNRKTLAKENLKVQKIQDLNKKSVNLTTFTTSIFDPIQTLLPMASITRSEKREVVHGACVKDGNHGCYIDELDYLRWKKKDPAVGLLLDKLKTSYKRPVSLAVHWKNQHLSYWVDQAIKSYKSDGTLDAIFKKHNWRLVE
ncbi:MAG: transporter substrate-binding domain-containing protein [Bdellovibrionota bacterium]